MPDPTFTAAERASLEAWLAEPTDSLDQSTAELSSVAIIRRLLDAAPERTYKANLREVLEQFAELMAEAGICRIQLDLEGLLTRPETGTRLVGFADVVHAECLADLRPGDSGGRCRLRRENCDAPDLDVTFEPLADGSP